MTSATTLQQTIRLDPKWEWCRKAQLDKKLAEKIQHLVGLCGNDEFVRTAMSGDLAKLKKGYGDSQTEVHIGKMVADLTPPLVSLKKEVGKLQVQHAAEMDAEEVDAGAALCFILPQSNWGPGLRTFYLLFAGFRIGGAGDGEREAFLIKSVGQPQPQPAFSRPNKFSSNFEFCSSNFQMFDIFSKFEIFDIFHRILIFLNFFGRI